VLAGSEGDESLASISEQCVGRDKQGSDPLRTKSGESGVELLIGPDMNDADLLVCGKMC